MASAESVNTKILTSARLLQNRLDEYSICKPAYFSYTFEIVSILVNSKVTRHTPSAIYAIYRTYDL